MLPDYSAETLNGLTLILSIGIKNPIVYAALQFYLRDDVTYIEALEIMVVSFAKQQELIDKEVLKLYQEK